jgi:hypothetical protein
LAKFTAMRRASSRVSRLSMAGLCCSLVKIEIPQRLPAGVADDEAFVVLIEHPRRPEAAVRHFGWYSMPSVSALRGGRGWVVGSFD